MARVIITRLEKLNKPEAFNVTTKDGMAEVWWSNDIARCLSCSGLLQAMSRSCSHAQALKRWQAARIRKASNLIAKWISESPAITDVTGDGDVLEAEITKVAEMLVKAEL